MRPALPEAIPVSIGFVRGAALRAWGLAVPVLGGRLPFSQIASLGLHKCFHLPHMPGFHPSCTVAGACAADLNGHGDLVSGT